MAAEHPVALVIDDEPSVGKVLANMLGRLGHPAISAQSGFSGLTLFCRHRESLRCVFLDVRMPGLDGLATLHELRRLDSRTPCFFMTGYSGQYSQDELIAAGARGVLSKPISLQNLATVLERLDHPAGA